MIEGISAMKTKKYSNISISEIKYEMSMLNAEKAGQIRRTNTEVKTENYRGKFWKLSMVLEVDSISTLHRISPQNIQQSFFDITIVFYPYYSW